MKIKQTRNTLSDTYLDAMKIRQEVFVKGQGVPLSLEIDENGFCEFEITGKKILTIKFC